MINIRSKCKLLLLINMPDSRFTSILRASRTSLRFTRFTGRGQQQRFWLRFAIAGGFPGYEKPYCSRLSDFKS